MLRHAQERPVVLYGHCAGSAIACEAARRLGPARVRALVVSSYPAPGSVRRCPPARGALPRTRRRAPGGRPGSSCVPGGDRRRRTACGSPPMSRSSMAVS
ncbi:thioesterase domain-containing protein [Streptomyces sp. NPDC002602]|uniref:thioesterase domain-containing protein n=1 Tax=Streptomyces sp. NPDC002602 TaxID=3364654 RepID=UPI0036C1CC12